MFLILALAFLSFSFNSCSVRRLAKQTHNEIPEKTVLADASFDSSSEEMPAFQGGRILIGYPVESKGFPKNSYDLDNRTVVGYPFASTRIPIKSNQLRNRIIVGYPIKSKGFPKNMYDLKTEEH